MTGWPVQARRVSRRRAHPTQTVVTLREEMRQPHHRRPAHVEPAAIPVHRKAALQQHRQPHPAHLRHQQRDIVHPLRLNVCSLDHAESLPQFVYSCDI